MAKKSADCFKMAIMVVAKVSWMSAAWEGLGFSGRKLYYKANQNEKMMSDQILPGNLSSGGRPILHTFMKDLK